MAILDKTMRTEQIEMVSVYCMQDICIKQWTVQRHQVLLNTSKIGIFYMGEVQRVTPTFSMQESNDEHNLRIFKAISHSCGGLLEVMCV